MRKVKEAAPSQCQLFPPQSTDLPSVANVSPRLIHLLAELLRKAAEHHEDQPRSQDAGHE